MQELLNAIINLINTGGALADDALYLFFLFKVAQAAAWPLAVLAVGRVVVNVIQALRHLPTDQLELRRNEQLREKRAQMADILKGAQSSYASYKTEEELKSKWPDMYDRLIN